MAVAGENTTTPERLNLRVYMKPDGEIVFESLPDSDAALSTHTAAIEWEPLPDLSAQPNRAERRAAMKASRAISAQNCGHDLDKQKNVAQTPTNSAKD